MLVLWLGRERYRGQNGDIALPQTYVVKYLGSRDARGLWGIKHTRHPVDELVAAARSLPPGTTLPYLRLEVSGKGVHLSAMPQNQNQNFEPGLYPIESISYGVQDLVYTRVFAMIVVRDSGSMLEKHPFLCHAFVCDSRQNARSLTLTLAKAFQDYSRSVKGLPPPRKFAIDLRSQEEIQADLDIPQESHA
ncbi:hypothetical protein AVEN_127119-1 [Araneus ventricosus]|uniref:PID domain-containing protein n=1 Tax=Araneus ventricosus TaxID=182803 RepID=A0A4Y2GVD3_ARAVE|nr:hypothetical protein AVEN_127119-1 [Araneus ventricosus]